MLSKKFILYVEWKKVKHYIIHKFHPLHLFTFIILSYTLKVTLLKSINMAFCALKELVITNFLFLSFYFWHQVFMFNLILTYFFICFEKKCVFDLPFLNYQEIILKGSLYFFQSSHYILQNYEFHNELNTRSLTRFVDKIW